MSVIRGKVIRDREWVSLQTSYGDWPFVKNDKGEWVDLEGKRKVVTSSLTEFLKDNTEADEQ